MLKFNLIIKCNNNIEKPICPATSFIQSVVIYWYERRTLHRSKQNKTSYFQKNIKSFKQKPLADF